MFFSLAPRSRVRTVSGILLVLTYWPLFISLPTVMQETLHSLPLVLDEPPPRVYFIGFGDSSLDFKLYVYSRQLADRLPLMHAVHESILEALRKNGIEIPFPQRDLHIRSTVQPDGGAS